MHCKKGQKLTSPCVPELRYDVHYKKNYDRLHMVSTVKEHNKDKETVGLNGNLMQHDVKPQKVLFAWQCMREVYGFKWTFKFEKVIV